MYMHDAVAVGTTSSSLPSSYAVRQTKDRGGHHLNPNPSVSSMAVLNLVSNVLASLNAGNMSWSKHVCVVGNRPSTPSPCRLILNFISPVPVAGIRSLPVTKASNFFWSAVDRLPKNVQKSLIVGSASPSGKPS